MFFPGPSHIGGRLVLDGRADAMFQEAAMAPDLERLDTPLAAMN